MRIENVLQGSEAWLALRAGRITGSRMIDVLALSKPKTALAVVDLTTGEIGDVLGNGVRAAAKAKKLGDDRGQARDPAPSPCRLRRAAGVRTHRQGAAAHPRDRGDEVGEELRTLCPVLL